MSLDVRNPEHCEALAWACEALREPNKTTQGNGLKAQALFALSTPEGAAEVIRQLVERAGVFATDEPYVVNRRPISVLVFTVGSHVKIDVNHAYGQDSFTLSCSAIYNSIIRLLALAPKAGAETVLAALRGTNGT